MCYKVVGKEPEFIEIYSEKDYRKFFSFYNYEYKLDTMEQNELIREITSMEHGLKEAYLWYKNNKETVNRKEYMKFIDENFK